MKLGYKTSLADLINILRATKCMVSFEVDGLIGDIPPNREVIELPVVKHLALRNVAFNIDLDNIDELDETRRTPSLSKFLQYLKTPSLESLRLEEDHNWNVVAFQKFIHNSAPCKIGHFSWGLEVGDEIERLTSLIALRHLKILELLSTNYLEVMGVDQDERLSEGFHHELTIWSVNSKTRRFPPCPNLETIQVDFRHVIGTGGRWDETDSDTDYDSDSDPVPRRRNVHTPFADMIQSRFAHGHLKTARILNASGLSASGEQLTDDASSELIRLFDLRASGLNIHLEALLPVASESDSEGER